MKVKDLNGPWNEHFSSHLLVSGSPVTDKDEDGKKNNCDH